ncbi:BgTH12-04197 [Blumeria graminis f. sp. triticale]|uniref:BgTH12-04197 n=1 Tax=Blumeria graminis f. sp. triticale TaxID=1689686 RepID=A0A9W4GC10_BLUGR|nr:BgTH12-04197 [Blumeria graminis f. sp. triticale]
MRVDLDDNVFYKIVSFWEVFFEDKTWSKQTSRIWESYQNYENAEKKENLHKAKSEKILERNMPESEVWEWLHFFRQKFLDQLKGPSPKPSTKHPIFIEEPFSQLRGQYCRTGLMGRTLKSKGKTQLDFMVKSINLPNDGPAEWENINVLGEFTISPWEEERKKKFIQLSRSVREVFCAQPLRRFIHGFCLFGDQFELWLFDRSGAYSAGPKKIVDDKEMLVRAISSYLLMSDEELGRDMSILRKNGQSTANFTGSDGNSDQIFEIKPKPVIQSTTLVTRGTTCYKTKDKSTMIKYSWSRSADNAEVRFMKDALPLPGVVKYRASQLVYQTNSHLGNLDLSGADPWDLKADDHNVTYGSNYHAMTIPSLRNRRLIRIAMTPSGRTIYSSGSILDFVAGIRDAIKGHEGLVGKEILHGDISEGNIILLKPSPANDLHGMLIDLDHSVRMKGNLALEERQSLTGTIKFMALERLEHARDTGKSIGRTCRHDLESFFYVFIVGCIEYEDVSADKANNLDRWCTNDVKGNFKLKRDDVEHFDQEILKKFTTSFKGLKELAKMFRIILFNDDGQYIETPQDCGPLYRKIIKAFDKTIEDIKGKI